MVGRLQSSELAREALAHEDLCSRPGPLGRAIGLVSLCVVLTGLFSLVPISGWSQHALDSAQQVAQHAAKSVRWNSPTGSAIAPPRPPIDEDGQEGRQEDLGTWGASIGADRRAFDDYSYSGVFSAPLHELAQDEGYAGLDYSLIIMYTLFLGACIVPPVLRTVSTPSWMAPSQPPPWSAPLFPPGGADNPFAAPNFFTGGGAPRGRVVDVKPGELRGTGAGFGSGLGGGSLWPGGGGGGGGGGGFGGGGFGGGGFDWASGRQLGGAPFGSPMPPSPWSSAWQGGFGAAPPGAAASAPPAAASGAGVGAALGALGAWFGLAGGQHGQAHGLPTEAEVTETYATFGLELQAWAPALATVIERDVIEPLLRQLDESDRVWHQALQPRGWWLTVEAPRQAYQGLGPSVQELSVFDRHLPRPFCDEPKAVELWADRQKLESFLLHPCFEPSQRGYTLERLREWRSMGLSRAMRYQVRSGDSMPTDAHILENLLVTMLNFQFSGFASSFLAGPQGPPQSKHMGQMSVAYLRQVTDQALVPRPAPHYEVVTSHKTWKFRPGTANMLEALALMLFALKRHSSPSYQSFPQALRSVVEGTAAQRSGAWY